MNLNLRNAVIHNVSGNYAGSAEGYHCRCHSKRRRKNAPRPWSIVRGHLEQCG